MLKYRLLTAIIAIPIIICVIWFANAWLFALLLALIILLGAWEWGNLVNFAEHRKVLGRWGFVALTAAAITLVAGAPMSIILLLGLIAWFWALLAICGYQRGGNLLGFQHAGAQVTMGLLALAPCWVGLYVLRDTTQYGPGWLLFALLVIWAADTGAYFTGRWCGQRSLASRVSPKKTWEGFLGGLALALLVTIIGSFIFDMSWLQRGCLWGLGVLTAAISVVGDLTVSLLKRLSGVKDSGQILPGHGGLLDRLDSISAAITVFALGTILLGF